MSCKWEVSEKKTRNGRTDQRWIYWVPRVSYIQPAMIGSNTTTSVPHTAQSNKTFIQKLTSSWTPCFSSPSTVHLMTEGGLDSWLEQTKLMSPPIWALSGPLMWTLSPETENTPINLQLQSNLAGKPSNLHFSMPCITFFLPSEKWNNSLCKTSHLKWREIYQVLNKLQHKQQSEISLHRIFACMHGAHPSTIKTQRKARSPY